MRHAWMEILYTCRNEVQSFYATYWSSWSEGVNPHGQAHSLSLGPWSLKECCQHSVTGNFDTSQCPNHFTAGRSHHEPVPFSSAEMWKARPLNFGRLTAHISSSRKKMSGWGWERHGPWTITSNHPCGKAVAARIALGEPKCHRQSQAAQRPAKVTVYTFQCLAIVLKQFVITEAFYDHLMPWNLPNSNESWKSKRQEFHEIQILGCPFFVDAIQAPYSHCRPQIPGTKCPDSCRCLCRMSFNWICLMPSWTQNQLANPGATWDDGTRTVQRSKLFVPSHRHHPDRFQVALS